jgi:hypothetical protein
MTLLKGLSQFLQSGAADHFFALFLYKNYRVIRQAVETLEVLDWIRKWWGIGKKSKVSWPPGAYRGEITISRETPAGPMESRREARLDVF